MRLITVFSCLSLSTHPQPPRPFVWGFRDFMLGLGLTVNHSLLCMLCCHSNRTYLDSRSSTFQYPRDRSILLLLISLHNLPVTQRRRIERVVRSSGFHQLRDSAKPSWMGYRQEVAMIPPRNPIPCLVMDHPPVTQISWALPAQGHPGASLWEFSHELIFECSSHTVSSFPMQPLQCLCMVREAFVWILCFE